MRYRHLIRPFGLILNPLRVLAATIGLSLGCISFAHAQKPHYPTPAPNYVPPKGAPLDAAPPPSFGDQLTATPGLNLGEAAPAQTSENFAFAAPNFVGDFIGGAAAGGGGVIIDSLVLGTVPNVQYTGVVNSGSAAPVLATDGIFGFTITSVQSQQQIFPQMNPGTQIAIQNDPAFQSAANNQFVALHGNIGTTVFDQAGSLAIVTASTPGPGVNDVTGTFDLARWAYNYVVNLNLPSPGAGSVVGIQKLVENGSPIPRDRILFNYSMFNNVRFTPGGLDVNRFVVGFEKTFLDESCSFELRAPFASTMSSDQIAGAAAATSTEFGNLTMYGKALMASGADYAIGAGLAVAVPTADNINVRDANGTQLVQVRNQSVHLLPYLGGVYTPSAQLYTQAILQFDTVTSGNATLINNGGGLARAGSLNDPTWLFASFNAGYWVYRSSPADSISGVSPLIEVHYNTTLNNTDVVSSGAFQIGNRFGTLDMVNMVFGVNLEMYGRNYVSLAYVTPVSNGADRFFDGELRVLCNRYWW